MLPPLTPADCDLRDFAFMPLDVVRLRDSDLVSMETAEAFRAAVMLWCASWHQVPAASLPDDDRVLASLAGYGRVVKEWQKERPGALRGWIKCSDGRLYHPVVAEKANEAWISKLKQRLKTECARIKKHNERHGTAIPYPEFEAWMTAGCHVGQQLPVPDDTKQLSRGQLGDCLGSVPSEIDSKGQGEGQGTGTEIPSGEDGAKASRRTRRVSEAVTLATYLERCKVEGRKPIPPDHFVRKDCRDAGITDEMLQIAWIVFKRKYTEDEKGKRKRYSDWPRHFANAINERWAGLWVIDPVSSQAQWSHTGLQQKAILEARAKAREGQHEHA